MELVSTRGIKRFAGWLIAGGLLAMFGFAGLFLRKTAAPLSLDASIATNVFGDYGVLVGGVAGSLFTLATVLLLIASLREQQRNFAIIQIENRFFEMVKIHRDNSASVAIKDREGKKIFITLLREFDACFEAVMQVAFPSGFDDLEGLNIAYLCFYYGAVGKASQKILRHRLEKRYGDRYVAELFTAFASEQARLNSDKDFPYTPFDGHQSRLGHYFRHLFQAVRYIDEQPEELVPAKNKYGYIKLLRAQLSTQEQALFLLNSLSDLGARWREPSSADPRQDLVTHYNLIKNIPFGFLSHVDAEKYYPGVRFEGESRDELVRGSG